jgi:hypothetical protein
VVVVRWPWGYSFEAKPTGCPTTTYTRNHAGSFVASPPPLASPPSGSKYHLQQINWKIINATIWAGGG